MKLILLYGPPAAGKLTVATELAKLSGYKVLDNHKVVDYLPYVFPRNESRFEAVRSRLGRDIRLLLFAAVAENSVDTIATFAPLAEGGDDFIRSIIHVVTEHGGEVVLVQLLPRREVLEQRVTNESRRSKKVETVKRLGELIDQYPSMFETFPDFEHLVIDNSEISPDAVAQTIFGSVSKQDRFVTPLAGLRYNRLRLLRIGLELTQPFYDWWQQKADKV